MIVASSMFNDKGYGDRSLLFFKVGKGPSLELVGTIKEASDDVITDILVFEGKIAVLGMQANLRLIEFKQTDGLP